MEITWNEYIYDDPTTAPPKDEVVWIVEVYYKGGVTLGICDDSTFWMLPEDTDDISVTHWATMKRPEPPEVTKTVGQND